MKLFVPPELNNPRPGKVLIVGRDPGGYEVIEGRPFVGPAGVLLDSMLSELGLLREEVNIANVVGYQPFNDEFKTHPQDRVAEGQAMLRTLIKQLQPKLIITLGNEAAHTLLDGNWPSSREKGLTVYGAKGIEERRGYFWDTPYGPVLTALHPAGVLRKRLPGEWLLRTDFRRARRWLAGKLPRDAFPDVRRLRSQDQVNRLLRSRLVGWDIETKWDNTAMLCSGFCGDDYQPYVAVYPFEYEAYGEQILCAPVPKVGHNGAGFDLPALRVFRNVEVNHYDHDTQTMWWALEPDIAGSEGAADEENEQTERRHMTRKGLAFLASVYFNLPWWKDYPDKDDPQHLPKMVRINSNDSFVTRWLAECLMAEIAKEAVFEQYRMNMHLSTTVLVDLHLQGLRVNEELRKSRQDALESRYKAARTTSETAALPFIVSNDLPDFRKLRKCPCCGGGKVAAQHCWRCGGLPKKPEKKADYAPDGALGINKHQKVAALKAALPPCLKCSATGKIKVYAFNPYSEKQMKTLLFEHLNAPRTYFKKKLRSDAAALKRVLEWARG